MRLNNAFATTLLALLAVASAQAKPNAPAKPAETAPIDSAAKDQGAFFANVSVDIVNVDVFVTDKSGNYVSGLKQDDFEVREDGRPVTISNFYAVDDQTPRPGPRALPGAAPPVAAAGAPPVVETPDEQRLYLVVYIDNFNISPFNRNRVFRRLRDFLDSHLGPEDKVMLCTYNRSFKERVAFTSDPSLVNSTLFDIEKETGYGVHRESDRNDIIQQIEDNQRGIAQVVPQVRAYAGSLYNDTQVSIDALKNLVDTLGGLPGRKAILYVSEGLPLIAGDDIYQLLNQKYHESSMLMEARDYDSAPRIQELAAQANANRVTFYTIDAAGLRMYSSASAASSSAGTTPGEAAFVDGQNIYNLQAPLLTLAESTGGRAIINTNDVGPSLDKVAKDFSSYYSLGYQPAHGGDGRYHEIDVRVKRKGLQVRHRAGYRDKPIEQRMSDATMASLLFGELANPLGVAVAVGEPRPRQDGNAEVPIHLTIPLDKITLIPQAGQQEGHLRAFIATMDEESRLSPVQATPIEIKIPAADLDVARQKGWGYDLTLLMRRGNQKVAVGVRDELGGTNSYVTEAVSVR